MRYIIAVVVLLFLVALPTSKAQSKTLTVAVIDTGIDQLNPKLCKYGHADFSGGSKPTNKFRNLALEPPLPYAASDINGHGTHVAGLIAAEAGDAGDYCIVALKFYSESNSGSQNVEATVKALRHAINIKVDVIDYSAGGTEPDSREKQLILEALNAGIIVVAAAGNENNNLDLSCNYYPACYAERVVMVGNGRYIEKRKWVDDPQWTTLAKRAGLYEKLKSEENEPFLSRGPSSNYGKRVTIWANGYNLESMLPGGRRGRMSGTSQATGVITGQIIKARLAGQQLPDFLLGYNKKVTPGDAENGSSKVIVGPKE